MTLLIVISQVYADEYTLGIEDVISVSLWEQPDLDSTVTVGPDGTIILPQPIGIIRAEGDTTAQISDAIRERLAPYILGELHITVQVTQYKSRKIVILGAVGSPGVYAYAKIPPMPEILVQAGGLGPEADLTQVKLFSADNKTPTQTINLQQLFNDSYPLWPKLAPGDTLWIPAKPPLEQARVGDSTAGASSPLNQTPDLTPQASPQNTNKILIHVLGKVPPNTFVFDTPPSLPGVLARAGVPANLLKQVKVIRGNGTNWTVNMEEYIATGDATLLPQLQSEDLVYISGEDPQQQNHVTLLGGVGSPGSYSIQRPVSLLDLLATAGGLTADADAQRIQITRQTADFILTQTVNLQEAPPDIQPGDKIWVPRKSQQRNNLQTTFSILRDAVLLYSTYRFLR
jgi:protein involved in polysaccharide export with SLBB domain